MTNILFLLAVGFFLGMRHATDPDHVVAVSTIVSREKSILRSGWIGILWGVGHTLTILVVGAAIILFGVVIPPRVGLALEFSVALMLILLGVLNLTGAMRWLGEKLSPTHSERAGSHSHVHVHDGHIHFHSHSHGNHEQDATHDGHGHQVTEPDARKHHGEEPEAPERRGSELDAPGHHGKELDPPHWLAAPVVRLGWFHALRPFLIGIVHGLAGSAGVALLVLGTIRNPRSAVFYLLVFGLGTIVGMMLMTLAFAVPMTVAGNRFAWLSRSMVTATGLLSLAFGFAIAYQTGVVDGLFAAHANWTPR
jgi:high-affinity nickel-transport protein